MTGMRSRWAWLYGARVCRILQRMPCGQTWIEYEEGGSDWVDWSQLEPVSGKKVQA